MKINDVQSAIDAFNAVLESKPEMVKARVQLANIYNERG